MIRRLIGSGIATALVVVVGAAALGGCGLLLDLDPADDAGSLFDGAAPPDTGPPSDGGMDTGAVCGDGVVDPGEECDEVSETCEGCVRVCLCPDVNHPCLERFDCVDATCEPVLRTGDCTTRLGDEGTCVDGACLPPGCGDGRLDGDETCDDGNDVAGDGCEPDCVPTCSEGAECRDGDPCNGEEVCLPTGTNPGDGATCAAGTPPPPVDCEICEPFVGSVLPDVDGDLYPADLGQACEGTPLDCDDGDAAIYPGAPEVCNGLDDDCDGATDEGVTTVTCGADRDGDGYPSDAAAMTMDTCAACPSGTAPIRTDATGVVLYDCWDVPDAFGPLVNPAQTMYFVDPYCGPGDPGCAHPFDYDCDGVEELAETRTGPDCSLLVPCRGDGWVPPVPPCGATKEWADCRRFLLVCTAHYEVRRQACR